MSGRFLLDTNIIIALFAGEREIKEQLAAAEEVFLPSIAVGELCYGAKKSARPQQNLERINELTESIVVLACDVETARYYGDVKNKLRLKGQPLPENDIWIAALALQHNLTPATRDAHFQEIEGLVTAGW
ncbi:MAG: type II toxin-antitoxin system VapC family toxin [Pseudomonadota bacterium]